jgi:hypothetical protein
MAKAGAERAAMGAAAAAPLNAVLATVKGRAEKKT